MTPTRPDPERPPPRRRRRSIWSRGARDGATLPAGTVLVVMLAALLVAMFVNADATLRKSEAKRNNPPWRTDVARGVADVADALGLTAPRTALDDAMGRHSSSLTPEQVLARQRAEQAKAAGGSTTTTSASTVAHLRTPTPAAPLKLWVGGDSITETFGTQLVRVSESTKLFNTTLDFHVSTGLSVPTYFNWPLHLAQDVIPKTDPDVVVIMFGANDGQNILMPDGKILTAFSPEWQTEYAKRVGAVMDLLKSPTNDRIVMWPGPPPMGPESGVHGMDLISHIDWSEARTPAVGPLRRHLGLLLRSPPAVQALPAVRHRSAAGPAPEGRHPHERHRRHAAVVDRAARPGAVGRPLRCAGPPRPERPATSEHQGANGHTPARAGGDLGAPALTPWVLIG